VPTLAELIRWYIDTLETISKWQRSKQAHLELLERHALGKCNALTLTPATLIDRVRSRRAKGAGPATVANDLIWIGVVLRAARSVRELPVRPQIALEARHVCSEPRLTGKARKRARRPTPEELERGQARDSLPAAFPAACLQASTVRYCEPAWSPYDPRCPDAIHGVCRTGSGMALASVPIPALALLRSRALRSSRSLRDWRYLRVFSS